MSKLIEFQNSYGEPVAFDPAKVTALRVTKYGKVQVQVQVDNNTLYIEGRFDDVLTRINNDR